ALRTRRTARGDKMTLITSVVIGVLFASGLYMTMSGSLFRLVLGLSVLSQGANLLVFASGGLRSGRATFISESSSDVLVAERLSQALILTAIVIGFAMTAFSVVLSRQIYIHWKTDNADTLNEEES